MNGDSLHEILRRHADDAPPGSGLLDAVKARSRRHRRHRRLRVAGAAAVAVTVAVTAPAVVRGIGDGPDRPAPPPVGQSPAVEPTGATTLVPAPDLGLPDFPFTPTWVPPRTSARPLSLTHDEFDDASDDVNAMLSHRGADPGVGGVQLDLSSTHTSRHFPDWGLRPEPAPRTRTSRRRRPRYR